MTELFWIYQVEEVFNKATNLIKFAREMPALAVTWATPALAVTWATQV